MRQPITVAVGDRHPAREIGPITQTHIVRFAGAGGDFNPLHHDSDSVAASGFPGVISMGQLQAGLLAGWLSDWVGAPVFVGDILTLSGEVIEVESRSGASTARIALQVARGDVIVVKGKAEVAVSTTVQSR